MYHSDQGERHVYWHVSQVLKQRSFPDGQWIIGLQGRGFVSGWTLYEETVGWFFKELCYVGSRKHLKWLNVPMLMDARTNEERNVIFGEFKMYFALCRQFGYLNALTALSRTRERDIRLYLRVNYRSKSLMRQNIILLYLWL